MPYINKPLSVGLLTGLSLVAGTSASTVSAATISDSAMFSTSDTLMVRDSGDNPPTTAQKTVNQTIQLNKFNPSLGTLTDVTFNLTSQLPETGLSLTVYQQEEGSNGSAEADFTLTIDDGITGILFDRRFIHSAECTDSVTCFASDNSNNLASYNDSTMAAALAGYQGLGTYDVTVSQLIALSAISAGGSLSGFADATFIGKWQGDLEVVYTFDEVVVPIPAAVWLFGSGLLGLVGLANRKQQS